MRVGVLGATGYAGLEVLRLAASHEDLEIVLATGDSNAGKTVASHAPASGGAVPGPLVRKPTERGVRARTRRRLSGAAPRRESAVRPSAARTRHAGGRPRRGFSIEGCRWTTRSGTATTTPRRRCSSRSVYGLVERHREELPGASLIAVPGLLSHGECARPWTVPRRSRGQRRRHHRKRVKRGIGSRPCNE